VPEVESEVVRNADTWTMPSQLLTCPYNRAHKIRPERMQYHLIKCRKQFPEASLVICPYNATHHVPRADEHDHLLTCPDKRIVEIQKYRLNEPLPGQHGDLTNPVVYGSAFIPQEVEGAHQGRFNQNSFLNETSVSSVGGGFIARSGRNRIYQTGSAAASSGGQGVGSGQRMFRDIMVNRRAASGISLGSVQPGSSSGAVPKRVARTTADPNDDNDDEDEDGGGGGEFESKDFLSLGTTASVSNVTLGSAAAAAATAKQLPVAAMKKPHVPLRRPKVGSDSSSSRIGITPAMTGGSYFGSNIDKRNA